MTGRHVHVILPEGVDDPRRPSGGNLYDRRLCDGLRRLGWSVRESAVEGGWPRPDAGALARLADALAAVPDGSVVLVDGLVASVAPEVLVPESRRLRLVVLLHMPLAGSVEAGEDVAGGEHAVLSAAAAVVATSEWSRARLLVRHGLDPDRVRVAVPGTDPAPLSAGSPQGGELLCVAALVPAKGQDVLLTALADLTDVGWRCVCVGSRHRDVEFVRQLEQRARDAGIAERVLFTGPRTGGDLEASYAAADAVVLPTRSESFGMVVVEALARGLPVLAADVGGVPEALGEATDGTRPGILVRPGDATDLAKAIRRWLEDPWLRDTLREAARERRTGLTTWDETTARVSGVLEGVAA